jgi:transcriptional regulator with XRE-family HTH domain
MALLEGAPSAGALLREWRQRRNLSQLELALRSAISARHLSFIETGRAHPSREMILHLAEHWNVVAFNRGVAYVNHNVAPELRTPPANALRIALHPDGLAPQISNLTDWSGFLLARLRREIEATGDPELQALYEELVAYPGVAAQEDRADVPTADEIMLKHELRLDDTDLALFCTFTTFGTARDLTLAELSIVAFYPANPQTAEALSAAVSEAQLG